LVRKGRIIIMAVKVSFILLFTLCQTLSNNWTFERSVDVLLIDWFMAGRSVVRIEETDEDVAQTKVWIWLHWTAGLEGHVDTRRTKRPSKQLMRTAIPQSRFTELGTTTVADVSGPAHAPTWRSNNWLHFLLPLLPIVLATNVQYNNNSPGYAG
jgi:hypothetical protein